MNKVDDFINYHLQEQALILAKEKEFLILLGCEKCGRRLCDWDGDKPINPKGTILENSNNSDVYVLCFKCFDREFADKGIK